MLWFCLSLNLELCALREDVLVLVYYIRDTQMYFTSSFCLHYLEFGTCSHSWLEYGASCYQMNRDTKSQLSASRSCQSLGGDLVDIDNNVEQAFVASQVVASNAWIGRLQAFVVSKSIFRA